LCGSSDGNVSIHEHKSKGILMLDDNWNSAVIPAHSFGVSSIAWATVSNQLRFISAGSDGLIKIWSAKENDFGCHLGSFSLDDTLVGHSEAINEIIWKYENDREFIISGGDVSRCLFRIIWLICGILMRHGII
jgi:WD40 repeat protein